MIFFKRKKTDARLVNMVELLHKAHQDHYAIAQININNLE
jgi:fructose/tagatose bisphosphate aldolase